MLYIFSELRERMAINLLQMSSCFNSLAERVTLGMSLHTGVSKCLKKVQMSGKTFGQKSKCLGLNRDFQANPGGGLSGEGVLE